jgi:hypothetical protein
MSPLVEQSLGYQVKRREPRINQAVIVEEEAQKKRPLVYVYPNACQQKKKLNVSDSQHSPKK